MLVLELVSGLASVKYGTLLLCVRCGRQRPCRLLALQRSSSLVGLSEPGITMAEVRLLSWAVSPTVIRERVHVEKFPLLNLPGTTSVKKLPLPTRA